MHSLQGCMNCMSGTKEKQQRNQTYMEINKTFKQSSNHVSSVNGCRRETSHTMNAMRSL